ncbi:hypothetical protein [Reyranella sp.]|uniref:hypothetical protein n=1 Tax=Reyranella sp. TaxID=1929291 RepID=UPI003D0EB146
MDIGEPAIDLSEFLIEIDFALPAAEPALDRIDRADPSRDDADDSDRIHHGKLPDCCDQAYKIA